MCLCLHAVILSASNFNQQSFASFKHHIPSHTEHDVIHINSDTEFLATASYEGWTGDGSAANPIIITGYSFRAAEHMFRLQNTNLHFRFCDNMLDGIAGIWCGVAIINAKNGEISNNTVIKAAVGIHVVQVENFNISNNIVYDNFMLGIVVEDGSKNVIVSDNVVYDHPEEGIVIHNPVEEVPDSVDCILSGNTVFNNGRDGILLGRSDDVNITDNLIYDNALNGITAASGNHIISGNVFYNNRNGIQISSGRNTVVNNSFKDNTYGISVASSNNLITRNYVSNSSNKGIRLHSIYSMNSNGSDNTILNNTIVNCTDYGLEITSACSNNSVKWNNFFNNSDSCQVFDNGINNEFLQNFYSEWIEPDSNFDGFVDDAYMLDGDAENSDHQPLALPCQPIPEWYSVTSTIPHTTTTSTTANQPPPLLELAIAGASIIVVSVVIVVVLKKRG